MIQGPKSQTMPGHLLKTALVRSEAEMLHALTGRQKGCREALPGVLNDNLIGVMLTRQCNEPTKFFFLQLMNSAMFLDLISLPLVFILYFPIPFLSHIIGWFFSLCFWCAKILKGNLSQINIICYSNLVLLLYDYLTI